VDTGVDSLTGTRVRLAAAHLSDGPIMVTYGDGVAPIDLDALLAFHREKGKLATITAVQPPSRFGELVVDKEGLAREFAEKPQTSAGSINGGFMIFEREAIERYFPTDFDYMLEREPLGGLASDGELAAFEHHGLWQCVDTPRERTLLDELWTSGEAPWQIWDR
jgi:glucose-1-phosphate cytidylyltransferase